MAAPIRSPAPPSADSAEPFPEFPTPGPSSAQQHQSNLNNHRHEQNSHNNYFSGHPQITTPGHEYDYAGDAPTPLVDNIPGAFPSSRSSNIPTGLSQVRRRPIGIRRLPSAQSSHPTSTFDFQDGGVGRSGSGRNRSSSAPMGYHPGHDQLSRQNTRTNAPLPTLPEDPSQAKMQPQNLQVPGAEEEAEQSTAGHGRRRTLSNAARSVRSRLSHEEEYNPPDHEYENNVVDFLDVVDPEVAALTTLTNVQNSLFVPDLGRWLNRRPTYNLSRAPTTIPEADTTAPTPIPTRQPTADGRVSAHSEADGLVSREPLQRTWSWQRQPAETELERTHSISSEMTDSHYAVLPSGVSLKGWSEEDKEMLDDYVRHMLHSRRSRFKQKMKAFGKYVRKPLGFFITLYAVLITLFGLAWVLFLIGWIYIGDSGRRDYIINVVDNVLVALFALMGDGLAPFRIVDTYHMIYIAHYHHYTWDQRKRLRLPKLRNRNDLPTRQEKADLEAAKADHEASVLTESQQRKLIHHQSKFARSHSFYKPHETATHYAFPLRLLVAIVVLLDCHSLFQIALGTCTWAINYHTRPQALTATILSCSITVNITAGVLISIGDRRTRKKDIVMRMARQELTQQAIKKLKKDKTQRMNNIAHAEAEENLEVVREEEVGDVRARTPTEKKKR